MSNNNKLKNIDSSSFSLGLNESVTLTEALIDSAAALNSSMDLSDVLERILENLGKVVPYDTANIMLIDENDRVTARIAATNGYKKRNLQDQLDTLSLVIEDTRTLKTMFHTGLPITVMDTNNDPDWKPNNPTRWIRSYAGSPIHIKDKIIGFLNVNSQTAGFYSNELSDRLQAFSDQAGIAIHNAKLMEELQRSNQELVAAYESTLLGWSKALELRDIETEGHSQRVVNLTIRLAIRLGLKFSDLKQIKYGALLHDIGKIGIPDSILNKPGPLTDQEWVIMRQHPLLAYNLLKQIPYLSSAMDIPYCHHEKWDGTGYPCQLKHEQIPYSARIFSIVDVWDGLLSKRPYHPPWEFKKVVEYIKEQSGKHFDPNIVNDFLSMIGELYPEGN